MSDKARAMALSMMNIAGQGQTDFGLKQRPGIVNVEQVLPCDKANPITTLEETQR